MPSKIKTARIFIFRGIDYIVWAGMFGLITYWYWFAMPNMLNVYIWNILGISSALLIDKIRLRRIYKKLEEPLPTDEKARRKLAKKDVGSLKTSLYLFYIFALIFSQVLAMDMIVGVSENIRGYFQSVEKGILVLFAMDNLIGYLVSDNERMKKYKDRFKDSQNET